MSFTYNIETPFIFKIFIYYLIEIILDNIYVILSIRHSSMCVE